MKKMIWIVVADSSLAKIFKTEKLHMDWELEKQVDHPEGREKDTELVADKYGSYMNIGTSGSSSYAEQTDPKEAEIEEFARYLAKELNLARTHNLYRQLVLVAPPHFQGLINKHLDPQVDKLVIKRLEKDYTKIKEHELIPRLKGQIQEF